MGKVGKQYKKFQKDYLADLKEIRNITIAHRDKNPVKQIEILDKLNLITHGILSWMVIMWFEDFKKIELLIYNGIAANRDAKNATEFSGSNPNDQPAS